MRRPVRFAATSFALAAALASPAAFAIEFKDLGGRPLTVDITNSAIANYHFDNRNDPYDPAVPDRLPDPGTRVDDNYFDFVDRLNVQVGYWRFRLNVRLDSQVYAGTVGPDNVTDFVIAETEKNGQQVESGALIDRSNSYLREVNTRFINAIYPAKLSLTYQQPGLEVTAGDFYAQLGRGIVLSVRKIDELATDTTIRGGKVQASQSFGNFRIGGTALAGQLNPQRGDEATGRLLTAKSSPLFFGFPEQSVLQRIDPATGQRGPYLEARPTYFVDTVFGGRLEGGHTLVQVAGNVSVVLREDNSLAFKQCERVAETPEDVELCDIRNPVPRTNKPELQRSQIRTFSGSVSLPQLSKYADLYVEVAGQQMVDGVVIAVNDEDQITDRTPDLDGYAVYVNANGRLGPVTLTLEGKHNRRLFPLAANVEPTFPGYLGTEFQQLAYSNPPTAEPIYVEPVGAPNVSNTGGRAEVKYRFNREASVYGWLGYYASFSEKGEALAEDVDENRSNSWDSAFGADLGFEKGKTYVKAWAGGRLTDLEVPAGAFVRPITSAVFYREGYVRYDIVKHLTGSFSLQSQGFHRHRYLPERFGDPWWEGENYLALQWAPRLSATFGYEYTSQPGCSRDAKEGEFCHYVSGGLKWNGAQSDGIWGQIFNSVTMFVGQRRAAIRCVSGVCRQFPPFEGAKLELVSRF